MRRLSPFTSLCAAMNEQLTPALRVAGFTTTDTPFRRDLVRYEFRRLRAGGAEVLAVLFNRQRAPLFSVQLYIERTEGVDVDIGGDGLVIGTLSPAARRWPLGVTPFSAAPGRWQRLRGGRAVDVNRPIQELIALLPVVNRWFVAHERSSQIVEGRLVRPGPW